MKNLVLLATFLGLLVPGAQAQTAATPPVTTDANAGAPANIGFETDAARTPDYLRALSEAQPQTVEPFAKLLRVTLTRGTLPPAVKVAMGLAIARDLRNDYAAQHLERLLRATPQGAAYLAELNVAKNEEPRSGALSLPVGYALRLTRDIHGVDEAYFRRVSTAYNDSQIVELTQTVCTLNYFVRLCAALNLKPEPWLATTTPAPLPAVPSTDFGPVRVTLASDAEMNWAAKIVSPTGGDPWGLGVRVFNSQRAMLRSPEIGAAWMDYWQSVRTGAKVPRSTLLQVSYAVSSANGCRYCIVHQVVGLRREKVDVAKLLAMQKDDAALSESERAAVVFARKLTKNPPQVTPADFATLQTAFSGGTAMEIVLQTCAFSYMNRFTDGLRLPSEDEAVHIYKEVYGDKPPLPARVVGGE